MSLKTSSTSLLPKVSLGFITYQLMIVLTEQTILSIGRLGIYSFPIGTYVYTGSARRNINKRIARHLRHEKKLKWHIDYLLASPHSFIDKIAQYDLPECEINQQTDGIILIPGFGSSDCQAGCGSHLKYLCTTSNC